MQYAEGALREGLLYDMAGRIRHEDVRERSVSALQERYHVDNAHAAAVEQTAVDAYRQVAASWGIDSLEEENLLRWACRVHEIGLAISHTQYHKHGAYLLRYSDLSGFSRQLQQDMATLVRGHRRKFTSLVFEGYEKNHAEPLKRLCILLRLAVLLQHARSQEPTPPMRLKAGKRDLEITLQKGWLESRPLTRADLDNEREYLSKLDYNLTVREEN